MSVRLACLLSLALVAVAVAPPALAKTKHTTHHSTARKAEAAKPALIWRGDVTTGHAIGDSVEAAWKKTGHGAIEVQTFNTASGLDAVRSGAADIAGVARGVDGKPNEAGLTFTPVAWDGLVLITNPLNPVSNLTARQLHDIYLGKITNWNEVGGKDEPIHVYAVASPGDGVEFSLRKLLFGRGNQPVAAPRLYLTTTSLQQGVALDPQSLGVSALSNVAGNAKLKMLDINGVAPSVATVANGSYPLYNELYVVSSSANPKASLTSEFVTFLGSDAAKAEMRRHDLTPYTEGNALASGDEARRARLLAAVGASPERIMNSGKPPLAAPGATYAARVAQAPTSERTLEAQQALEARNAKTIADKAKVVSPAAVAQATAERRAATSQRGQARSEVANATAPTGESAAAPAPAKPSLDGVQGDATTVQSAAGGKDFARVSSLAWAPKPPARASASTYTVGRGDTLYSIAKAHAVDVADLRRWNHLGSDELKPGEQLQLGNR